MSPLLRRRGGTLNPSTLLSEAQEINDLRRWTSSLGDQLLQKKQQLHVFILLLAPSRKVAREWKRMSMETRKTYITDLGEREWQIIEPFLPEPRRLGRKIEYSRREILNAIFISIETDVPGETYLVIFHHMVRFRTTTILGDVVGYGKRSIQDTTQNGSEMKCPTECCQSG